jgi:predicted CXXCH cytochrome family protein
MHTPAQLPVDWKGDVTCSTCHRVHGDTPGKMRLPERGRRFCTVCHDDVFFDRMLDRGTSLLAFGHLRSRTDLTALNLDGISLGCMECHMDNAPGANVDIDDRGVLRHTASAFNHPVGSKYASAAVFGGYRPAARLDPAILLPDGRISCGSCHRGYTERHGDLTVATAGSRLCYECHEL